MRSRHRTCVCVLATCGQCRYFADIGNFTTTDWAIDGLQNLVVRGLGLRSTLAPAGVLLAYAAAFFGLAVWRFRFE